MDYNFREIEEKWQRRWERDNVFRTVADYEKPKYYVLDMFPYPSGAGLHVGHPLGYIASDIYSRYKLLNGFNVLHPMGFDAFGLPAEQYAIQTGQHPAVTTENNINRYREQLKKLGFSYDWSREVRTCAPGYYKWTQWVFIKLFNHWYNNKSGKAEPIGKLTEEFRTNGNNSVDAARNCEITFSASQWASFSEKEQQEILLCYRLAYLSEVMVNWCPALGTVLANDEIKDGLSVRGGHPVEQRKMKQWCLRITAYAERLLSGLDKIEWTDALKEMQRNWIGRSEGALLRFELKCEKKLPGNTGLEIFTTRPDTVFGCSFMVLAPEHKLVPLITSEKQREEVEAYILQTKKRSERERMTEVTKVSGCNTGALAVNPFTMQEIPVWISEYVLPGYGTGAIMAVPAHDSRDFLFARHFNLPIPQVIVRSGDSPSDTSLWTESYDSKEGVCVNSGFIGGMAVAEGAKEIIRRAEEMNIGKKCINYRLRDAIFSRQRYWGEPFPVYFKNGIPYCLNEEDLPLALPETDSFLPAENGQPPLARVKGWNTPEGYPYELSTMPGFAGSSGYYFRFMDPNNNEKYFSAEAVNYWQDVDLYIGGTEHATGHLIYARFWCKFLYDMGLVPKDEPFRKLINQGMILGVSEFIHSVSSYDFYGNPIITLYEEIYCYGTNKFESLPVISEIYYSAEIVDKVKKVYLKKDSGQNNNTKLIEFRIPLNFTQSHSLKEFNKFKNEFRGSNSAPSMVFVCKSGYWHLKDNYLNWVPLIKDMHEEDFFTTPVVEKMSKSKWNVINPDDIIDKYGADTLRLYEMFLGPLEQSKPWDTNGIEGVHRFLRKLWRLFHPDSVPKAFGSYRDENNVFGVTGETPDARELKPLHKLIKKVKEDIESFSFNTAVSAFMICVNELTELKCNKRAVLEPLVITLSPFAPHISEELWEKLGNSGSVVRAAYPAYDETLIKENVKNYPVSFNGKVRYQLELPVGLSAAAIEEAVLGHELTAKWLGNNKPKKIIVVPEKIINIVC